MSRRQYLAEQLPGPPIDPGCFALPGPGDVEASTRAAVLDEGNRCTGRLRIERVQPQQRAAQAGGETLGQQGSPRANSVRQQEEGRVGIAGIPLGPLCRVRGRSLSKLRINGEKTRWLREVFSPPADRTPAAARGPDLDRRIQSSPVYPGLPTGDDQPHTIDQPTLKSAPQTVPERVLVPAAVAGGGQHRDIQRARLPGVEPAVDPLRDLHGDDG